MLTKFLRLLCLALLSISLTACLSFGPLSYKQVKVLKQEGFTQTEEGWSLGLPEQLLFNFNEPQIRENHVAELQRLATQLQKYNLNKVKITGHTDNVGNPEYNLKLSEERARNVAQIFQNSGFDPKNIQASGKGSSQPVEANDTEEQRATNRRVAVIIIP